MSATRPAAGNAPRTRGVQAAPLPVFVWKGKDRRGIEMKGEQSAKSEALLRAEEGSRWASGFDAVVCGEDTARKKPDPEVYLAVLDRLGLPALQTLAIEDSPGGAAAARAAGVPVVVTRSHCFADAIFDEVLAIGPGLHRRGGWRPVLPGPAGDPDAPVDLALLRAWHALHDARGFFPSNDTETLPWP